MEIKKIYKDINPELLFDEVRDYVQKQGTQLKDSKMQTYSTPTGTVHISRGTLIFSMQDKECLRAHIVGSAVGETRMVIDIDEAVFSNDRLAALERDLAFIFGPYEVKEAKK